MPDAEAKATPETSLREQLKLASDPVNNAARRAYIEKKLEPIDIGKFLFHGYVEQKIPLALPVTFRTLSTRHTLWLDRLLGKLVGNETVLFANNYGQLLNLSAAVVSMGRDDQPLPDLWALEEESDFPVYETRMMERLKTLGKLPAHLTDDWLTNLEWFQARVRLTLSSTGVDDLKNV